ncbi:hypothetical protein SAMN04515691_2357 [Leifsonia sp. 98AMF]|uniref:hypothetical protein n=1 Tax=unclassified Leifsonia TaxID=2663824 RepID=UPI00087B089B|nr:MULTISPECIES: hypothetical protein [unclassified Leifsonia]SDH28473.1 hypothetical protein SAMN04515690_1660 [Leifsonia sp. 197AMF]SDJ09794.1 hypothetical protein SAMN04515684_2124 [Leifsonia sp. 466MF]SDJ60757.1 hypothetical protein SAMN04515683_0621 [Leifsonia sp. 157MF]SDN31033.1 hypothetical protein SAMN04515686_0307 [Leifsonia sp. 509MF]SEM90271.1 hypothetical protein SAMN04515685_0609 [Leifsonia sp. 467MF]
MGDTVGQMRRTPLLKAEGAAIVAGAASFVLAGIVALPLFWGRDLPIAGPDSVGQFVAYAGGIVAVLAYVVGRLWMRDGLTPFAAPGERRRAGISPVDVFDTIAIAVAHGVIALLGWLVLGTVLADGFQDATVYFLSASALAATAAAVTGYAVFLSAVNMSLMRLSTVLAAFVIVGILTAMLSAPDPHWWMLHLSALGMTQSISSLSFNLTLIIAGVIVTAMARYATDTRFLAPASEGDPVADRRRAALIRVRVGLILIGVLLAGVGLFPLNVSQVLHNVSAVGMVLVFSLVVFWVRAALPEAPVAFFVLGYVFFATIVAVLLFFVVGYYVLTATELVAGVVVFAWLIVYLRVSGAVGRRSSAGRLEGPPLASAAGRAQRSE